MSIARLRRQRLPRILHLTNAEKFLPEFIRMVRREFPHQVHSFRCFGKIMDGVSWPADLDTSFIRASRPATLMRFLVELHSYDRVILHGLFIKPLNLLLMTLPWLLRKCYWAIWGGDLYAYEATRRHWRWRRDEFIRRTVIRRIGHLLSYIPGDVQLARSWYRASGKYHECLVYLSNVFSGSSYPSEHPPSSPVTILVGNSASPTNHHDDAFALLAKLENQSFIVICPLSYGSKEYADKVILDGRRLFGDRFRPLLSFMPPQDYKTLLSTISIAVFAHSRQQAMGNTITMLGMGKTVYARHGITSTSYLLSLGLTVLPLEELSLSLLSKEQAQRNRELVSHRFSYKALVEQYRSVFGYSLPSAGLSVQKERLA